MMRAAHMKLGTARIGERIVHVTACVAVWGRTARTAARPHNYSCVGRAESDLFRCVGVAGFSYITHDEEALHTATNTINYRYNAGKVESVEVSRN